MNNRKSILCLFLLFLLSLGSLSVNAQTVSKVFKEQTLKTVLKEIESQTGLSIIYFLQYSFQCLLDRKSTRLNSRHN